MLPGIVTAFGRCFVGCGRRDPLQIGTLYVRSTPRKGQQYRTDCTVRRLHGQAPHVRDPSAILDSDQIETDSITIGEERNPQCLRKLSGLTKNWTVPLGYRLKGHRGSDSADSLAHDSGTDGMF